MNSTTKMSNVRWQVFMALLILCSINYVDRAVISMCMPLIQKDLGFSPELIGLILSSFFWGYTLMQIPSGWVADRFKPGNLIVGSGILWGVFQVLTGIISSSSAFMFVRALLGIAEAPIYPAGAKLQSVWLTSSERGRGASLLDAGSAIGNALGGPLVVLFLAWFGGWRAALIGAGVLTVAIVLMCRKLVSGDPDTHPAVNQAEREHIHNALTAEYEASKKIDSKPVGAAQYLTNHNFWCMLLGFYSYDAFWYGLMTWSPLYLAATQNIDIKTVGGSIFIIYGVGVMGGLLGGYITDKLKERGGNPNVIMRSLFVMQAVIIAFCMFMLSRSTSLVQAITLLTIAMFFLKWSGCLYWGIPSAISQRNHVGTVGGCMNFVGNIGGVVTPICVGLIVGATGSYFWALMMFVGLAIGIGLFPLFLNFNKKIGSSESTYNPSSATTAKA